MKSILDVCSRIIFDDADDFYVDFIGKGNVWINNTYKKNVLDLAKFIILNALKETAPGQLSIIGYDSDLSGVFAPFASLSSGETKVLRLIMDERDFKDNLNYAWQQIQSVQNVVQGRADSLIEFRETTRRPIEGYRLYVLSLDMGMLDNETRSKLSLLMKNGPGFGVSFLIISTTIMMIHTQNGKSIELLPDDLAPGIAVLKVEKNRVINVSNGKIGQFTAIAPEKIIEDCESYLKIVRNAELPLVLYDELHDMNALWYDNSIEGLCFAIGTYGINRLEISIGDEVNQRHNLIITGAVGQGKSNLLSVIIHSLCQRYSPKELQLYLLDFKEGVTFKAFSNIDKEDYLPHAKALGLESDPAFGYAVLDSLYKEYLRRMKELKKYGLLSIRELRKRYPDLVMPRIVVIIDEFQMMFDDEKLGQKTAQLLEKSVRLFRAAGIHFILASQTVSDGGNYALNQKKESIFSQVPIRIALKNSLSESVQTLGINNSAAAFLRPREAIVNLDYGELSQNKKVIIAYADEKMLDPLRRKMWEKAKLEFDAPYVFDGERRITILDRLDELRGIHSKYPVAVIGEKISVDGEWISVPITNQAGRNIAIIGTPDGECNNAMGILQSIAISIANQKKRNEARIIFCDFNEENDSRETDNKYFFEYMEKIGHTVEHINKKDFTDMIKNIENKMDDRTIYMFGACMDRWEYERVPYCESPLSKIVKEGAIKKIHFYGWWIKSLSLSEQIDDYTSAFNTKIFLRVDERTVQNLVGPFVRWISKENRGLICDSVEFQENMEFIPFSPITKNDYAEKW